VNGGQTIGYALQPTLRAMTAEGKTSQVKIRFKAAPLTSGLSQAG